MAKKTRKTRFVPRMILSSAALVSVVPAIALVDCGGDTSGSKTDAGQYGVNQGVAVAAFFDSGSDVDAGQFGVGQGVAVAAFFDSGSDVLFEGGQDSTTDANGDGPEGGGGHDSGQG